MAQEVVVDTWRCIPDTERAICALCAAASQSLEGFILASIIDAEFAVREPLWWETRRDAWSGNYAIPREIVIIGEDEIEVYFCTHDWCFQLYDCRQDGGCQNDEPRCLIQTFPASPE